MTTPAQHFCNLLYGDANRGHTAYFFLPSGASQWFALGTDVTPEQREEHTYLNLGIREVPTKGRGAIEDIIGIPGLWLDLDYQSGDAHKAQNLPPDMETCLDLLVEGPHAPSLIVHSGHGLQAYWLFNEAWYFDGDLWEERALASRMLLGWQRWFQVHAASRGWHVDSTADLTRVFRVPGSLNYKSDPPTMVQLLEEHAYRYEPADFLDYLADDAPSSTPKAAALTLQSIDILPLKIPQRIKYLIQHGDTIKQYPTRSEAVFAVIHALFGAGRLDDEVAGILLDERYRISEMPREKGKAWVEREIARAHQKAQNTTPDPVTREMVFEMEAAELRQKDFPPLEWFARGILHEGMVLFGGKSKRGKSWLMLNLAESIAQGTIVFGQYTVPQAQKVLYCALEDGPRRTKRRLDMIDPRHTNAYHNIKFAFRMPPLLDGGLEYITHHIRAGYKIIVVDVLAHVEKAGKNGLRDYHEVYETFAPLQELRSQYPFALIMITHLRKAESEEVFDNLHGSVAYQGAQDALWVLERKSGEETAQLHIRDKDAEDKVVELKFDGEARWAFVGEGEEHLASKVDTEVVKFLLEEARPQSIKEIMLGCGVPAPHYSAFRVRLHRMESKGIIVRTDRGRYAALRELPDTKPPF